MSAGRTSNALSTIFLAGVVAGVLDITYVFVVFGYRDGIAERVLQGIAAGLIGRDAAKAGGLGTAALGLGLHFVIALGAAATFYALSRRLRLLVRYWPIAGLLYGAAVWLFMNLVVLPLDANPPKVFPSPQWTKILIAHLICVGLPIALVVRLREKSGTR